MDHLFTGTAFAPFVPYMYLAGGLGVLIFCGNWLVTGSIQIARHFKISTLVVGLTVVAYVTSAPEMFICIGAALDNAHDIALGNVIGSNIANIGCILAIVVLISPIPIRNRAIGFDFTVMFFVTCLLLLFGFNGTIGTIEGICLVAILITYTAWSVIKSRRCSSSKDIEAPTIKPAIALLMILAAVIGMYFSSGWFVHGAREIALQWGVSERVIAVSIVAVGTSAPELISSLIAAFRKEADLSIGNIIGSNFFNIAGVLGVTTIVKPLTVNNHPMFVSDMLWLFGISIVLLLTMIPLSKGKINRWEGGILLLIFSAYMFILYR
ncbi:MAG: calcium/sodium antiporter [Chitinispirillia bacterium]|nr:calcium/sodium antiporter [Chitinispirillia bacterium]MCL2267857.1 calcium/sodium antiporter [Chitinispirillia bacterium]